MTTNEVLINAASVTLMNTKKCGERIKVTQSENVCTFCNKEEVTEAIHNLVVCQQSKKNPQKTHMW